MRTQALNIERGVADDPAIEATFVPVRYAANAGLLTRLPGLPGGIKGTLRGVREIRDGLGDASRFDAILWATWAAKSVPDLVEAAPSFLLMDMTPTQMEAMGEQYGYTKARARLGASWKRRATKRIYDRAARLFPWNDWVADSLRNDWNVASDKITPVSPGADTQLFRPNPLARAEDGVVRVLFVGGDWLRKGGDLLLRWLHARSETAPPVELHVVTRDVVPDAGPGVVFYRDITNNSPELVALYQKCDIFALPTRADCYSLVALEAMASGLPVVISNLGGIPGIVANGKTGALVVSDDYAGLAAALDRYVASHALRAAHGAAGRKRAETLFDSRSSVRTLLAAIK